MVDGCQRGAQCLALPALAGSVGQNDQPTRDLSEQTVWQSYQTVATSPFWIFSEKWESVPEVSTVTMKCPLNSIRHRVNLQRQIEETGHSRCFLCWMVEDFMVFDVQCLHVGLCSQPLFHFR